MASPVPFCAAAGAIGDTLFSRVDVREVAEVLRITFGAQQVVLTDSGTAALVLALRTAGRGAVALPAYGCPDLIAAAGRAGKPIRFYDVDPVTLGPDWTSLDATIVRGVDAVVLVHFFGIPADAPRARALCERHRVLLIEDAAQGVGASLRGRPLGATGQLGVMSFGRGKGLAAGGGGALLVSSDLAAVVDELRTGIGSTAAHGLARVVLAFLQSALSHPLIFALPSALPSLRLGEMIYREAGEPCLMPTSSAALLGRQLQRCDEATLARADRARIFADAAQSANRLMPQIIPGVRPGWLRFPMYVAAQQELPRAMGILRPYPRTLCELPVAAAFLAVGETVTPFPGAATLSGSLVTLPTHHLVNARDTSRLVGWLRTHTLAVGEPTARRVVSPVTASIEHDGISAQ